MDESTSFSDVEVFWDCDSPTPSAWKMLQQGPGKNDEVHCSPKLNPIKKRATKLNEQLYDLPRFEKSRQDIQRIITALTAVSKNKFEDASIVKKKLLIPELSDGESSDEDHTGHKVPMLLKTPENHTSLEILFDMSGKGEDLQPTILTNEDIKSRQTFINQTKPEESFLPADAWTDDEMFTDESLIGAMDNLQKIATPAKVHKAVKSSTPFNGTSKVEYQGRIQPKNETVLKVDEQSTGAKGFLDFFMEDSQSPKPKKTSGNLKYLQIKTIEEEKLPRNCERIQNSSETKTSHSCGKLLDNFKDLDTSIPLNVLEELIMDDSWSHNEDDKTNYQQKLVKENMLDNNSEKVNLVQKRTSDQLLTNSKLPMFNAYNVKVAKTADEDWFLDEDDDLLLEVIALTESQGNSVDSGSQKMVQEFHQASKCTRKEIEIKKRRAMEKKMQRMKKQY